VIYDLLKKYVRECLSEAKIEKELDEFCAVGSGGGPSGAIQGYTAPLGFMSAPYVVGTKRKKKKKKKRK
jgi:hypothetical protein